MKLITQRDVIKRVRERWEDQYGPRGKTSTGGFDKAAVFENLEKLDLETATPADVAQAIGNDSWTRIKCDECDKEVDAVIRLGEEPDYESSTACICIPCLRKAAELIPEP